MTLGLCWYQRVRGRNLRLSKSRYGGLFLRLLIMVDLFGISVLGGSSASVYALPIKTTDVIYRLSRIIMTLFVVISSSDFYYLADFLRGIQILFFQKG